MVALVLAPGGIIAWLIAGLIAGWLTGLFMTGGDYGVVLDALLGLFGAFLGGLLFASIVAGEAGFWGSIIVAFIGGGLLVNLVRGLSPRSTG